MDMREAMESIDEQLAHVWMVRTFLKHSDEAQEDDDLNEIHRELYDYMLALGGKYVAQDAEAYLRQAYKKFSRLRRATENFIELQPQISDHTNFKMAVRSLQAAVRRIGQVLDECGMGRGSSGSSTSPSGGSPAGGSPESPTRTGPS
ncbi:MAG: hypothetical protein KatS3mg110_1088 [Pirellulaceae bacterium]|nr:MAG: hypothetical protein KatS3mg110_1088 [Pirellulaceae bacterium]